MKVDKNFKPTIGKEIKINNPIPFMWEIDNFLTEDECNLLIESAKGNLKKTTVIDEDHNSIYSKHRTNTMTFFSPKNDELKTIGIKIENMISEFTTLPIEYQEFPFTILHYDIGEKFDVHFDHFNTFSNKLFQYVQEEGQRVFSFVIYLNNCEEGGHTYYDQLGIKIKPKTGKVLIHANLLFDGSISNSKSKHTAMPVIKGEKWSLVTFVRTKEYNYDIMSWRDTSEQYSFKK